MQKPLHKKIYTTNKTKHSNNKQKTTAVLKATRQPQIILAVGLQHNVLAHLREQHSMA